MTLHTLGSMSRETRRRQRDGDQQQPLPSLGLRGAMQHRGDREEGDAGKLRAEAGEE